MGGDTGSRLAGAGGDTGSRFAGSGAGAGSRYAGSGAGTGSRYAGSGSGAGSGSAGPIFLKRATHTPEKLGAFGAYPNFSGDAYALSF